MNKSNKRHTNTSSEKTTKYQGNLKRPKWIKDYIMPWIGKPNITKMSNILVYIYRFNVKPTTIPIIHFFVQIGKAIITFTWKSRVKNIEDNLEKELQEDLLTGIKTCANKYWDLY